MPLAKVDYSETRKFEDGEDWLELRVKLSKHEADRLTDITQNFRVDASLFTGSPDADTRVELESRVADANRTVFEILAVAWSLGSGKPTAGDYDDLNEESGQWVDKCITEVLAERRKRAEGNAPSSGRRSASGTARASRASGSTRKR